MRITRPFVLLALMALLAPRVEASCTSVWESNRNAASVHAKTDAAGRLAPLAPVAHLDTSTAADSEIVDSPRFDLGQIVLVERELEHEERFGLGPLEKGLRPDPIGGSIAEARALLRGKRCADAWALMYRFWRDRCFGSVA